MPKSSNHPTNQGRANRMYANELTYTGLALRYDSSDVFRSFFLVSLFICSIISLCYFIFLYIKCPYDTGIRTHDLQKHESPPITTRHTRPGLPPYSSDVTVLTASEIIYVHSIWSTLVGSTTLGFSRLCDQNKTNDVIVCTENSNIF